MASRSSVADLTAEGVKVVTVMTDPDFLGAVGSYYEQFPQVEDNEVVAMMH